MSRPVTRSMTSLMDTATQVEGGLSSPSHSPSPSDLVNEETQDAGNEDLDTPADEQEEEQSHANRELVTLRAEIQELRQQLERQAATLERSQMSASEAWHHVDMADIRNRGLQEENKGLTEDAAIYKEQRDEARSCHVRAEAEWEARNRDWQQRFQALQAQAAEASGLNSRHVQLQRQFEAVQDRLHSSEDRCRQAEQELFLLRRQTRPSHLHQPRNQREELVYQDIMRQSEEDLRQAEQQMASWEQAHSMDPAPSSTQAGVRAQVSAPTRSYTQLCPPGVASQTPSTGAGVGVPSPLVGQAVQPSPAPAAQAPGMGVSVPMPRQMEYDGSSVSFEGFMSSFNAAARMAGWTDDVKLFRLQASLRGEALDYFSHQLDEGEGMDFTTAVQALRARFEEKKATATYLAQLQARQLQPKETVSQYIAALKKLVVRAYPTAGSDVRDTIVLQQFLQGLQDPQASLQIVMLQPKSLEEARAAYETYVSLKGGVPRPPKAHAVQPEPGTGPAISQADFDRLANRLEASLTKKIEAALSQGSKQGQEGQQRDTRPRQASDGHGGTMSPPRPRRPLRDIQCYGCQEWGHYARSCPNQRQEDTVPKQPSSTHRSASSQQSEN